MAKRPSRSSAGELTGSLDFLIRDTRFLLTAQIENRIAQEGIALRVWFPLRVLYRSEGITQRELGRILGYGDAHAGVIVRAMERGKLIERRPSRVDKRRIDLYLTPHGKDMAKRCLRHMKAINDRIVAGFSATEARTLHALLLRAHDNLKDAP